MWVDDLIIFGKDMASINSLKAQLNEEYEMKDLGELKYFLGIQVRRDKERKIIHISQPEYIRTILGRYGMQDSKPASTPLPTGTRLIKQQLRISWRIRRNIKVLSEVSCTRCSPPGSILRNVFSKSLNFRRNQRGSTKGRRSTHFGISMERSKKESRTMEIWG